MANNSLDTGLAALFTISAATRVGLADVTLLDITLSNTATTVMGTSIPWAAIVSLGTLLVAALVNKPDWGRFTQEQQLLVGVTLGIVVAGTAIPELMNQLSSNVVVALGTIGIEAGGYWAIAQAN